MPVLITLHDVLRMIGHSFTTGERIFLFVLQKGFNKTFICNIFRIYYFTYE